MGKGDNTRSQILGHALRVASRVGLEGLTIGGLAGELGMSKSGLFAHFQSKEALQVEVLKAGSGLFKRKVLRPALRKPPGVGRLRALHEAWMEWTRSNELPGGCIFVAASVELDDRPGPARDYLVKSQKDWIRTLERFINECKTTGEIDRDADSEQIAQELWGIVLGFHFYNRLIHEDKAEARAKEAFIEIMGRQKADALLGG